MSCLGASIYFHAECESLASTYLIVRAWFYRRDSPRYVLSPLSPLQLTSPNPSQLQKQHNHQHTPPRCVPQSQRLSHLTPLRHCKPYPRLPFTHPFFIQTNGSRANELNTVPVIRPNLDSLARSAFSTCMDDRSAPTRPYYK